jgi:hypothetical protein
MIKEKKEGIALSNKIEALKMKIMKPTKYQTAQPKRA